MTSIDDHAVNAPHCVRVDAEETGAVAAALNALYLAATPTFAIMAVLSSVSGNADMMCSVTHDAWQLGGMVPMYALMSAFHSGPWLRRIFRR
jgi:hypothetical protein